MASFALPAYEFPPRSPNLNHMNMTPDGGTVPGVVAFVAGVFLMKGYGLLPNVAFVFGLVSLAKGRDRRAAVAGVIGAVTAGVFLSPAFSPTDGGGGLRVGYDCWLASHVALATAGLTLALADRERVSSPAPVEGQAANASGSSSRAATATERASGASSPSA